MSDVEKELKTRHEDEAVSDVTKSMDSSFMFNVSSAKLDTNGSSLQELIEAELSARLAPLQPDSLEDEIGDSPPDSLNEVDSNHFDSLDSQADQKPYNGILDTKMDVIKGALDPINTINEQNLNFSLNNHDMTGNTASLLTCDSLEAQSFSLDSLADAESGVDIASPMKLPSIGDTSPSPTTSLGAMSDLPNSPDQMSSSTEESSGTLCNHENPIQNHSSSSHVKDTELSSSKSSAMGVEHPDAEGLSLCSTVEDPASLNGRLSPCAGSDHLSAFVTNGKEDLENEDEDELPDLPDGDGDGEGDDELPELPKKDNDEADEEDADAQQEAEQKEDLSEAEGNETRNDNDSTPAVNGDVEANGDVDGETKKKKKRSDDPDRKGKKKRKKGDKKEQTSPYHSSDSDDELSSDDRSNQSYKEKENVKEHKTEIANQELTKKEIQIDDDDDFIIESSDDDTTTKVKQSTTKYSSQTVKHISVETKTRSSKRESYSTRKSSSTEEEFTLTEVAPSVKASSVVEHKTVNAEQTHVTEDVIQSQEIELKTEIINKSEEIKYTSESIVKKENNKEEFDFSVNSISEVTKEIKSTSHNSEVVEEIQIEENDFSDQEESAPIERNLINKDIIIIEKDTVSNGCIEHTKVSENITEQNSSEETKNYTNEEKTHQNTNEETIHQDINLDIQDQDTNTENNTPKDIPTTPQPVSRQNSNDKNNKYYIEYSKEVVDSARRKSSKPTIADDIETADDEFITNFNAIKDKLVQSTTSEDNASISTVNDEDDLAGVDVKKLTSSYLKTATDTTPAKKRDPSPTSTPSVPINKLTSSYLKTATDTPPAKRRDPSPTSTPSVPINKLVDSYTSSPLSSPIRSGRSSSTPRPSSRSGLMNGGERDGSSPLPPDYTPGISLRSLKSAYEASTRRSRSTSRSETGSGSSSPRLGLPKEEIKVSFSQLRDAYCSVASGSTDSEKNFSSRQNHESGVNIRNLAPQQISSDCKLCGKQVFQMEKIVAEKASWHKNCFRCKECNKALTLDTYSSHEGVMYCKPHFKQLFQPKAVIVDPEEAHKERTTSKPDYGLEDIQTMDVKQRFSMFESLKDKDDDKPRLEPANVRRSASLMNKAARFLPGEDEEYGIENSELGEFEDEEDDEEEYEDEEEEDEEEEEQDEDGEVELDENGEPIKKPKTPKTKLKKKERPMSFTGMGDLQTAFEKKTRREKMSQQRKEELSKFRQMLCAGKNISLKEKFETGNFDDDENSKKNGHKERVKIEGRPAARSIKERFEKGEFDEEGNRIYIGEKQEVQEIFKDAETANRARNLFRQIDSQANQDENGKEKLLSSAERKRLQEIPMSARAAAAAAEIIRAGKYRDLDEEDEEGEGDEDEQDLKNLSSRFKFFATYEERQKEQMEKKRLENEEKRRKPFRLNERKSGWNSDDEEENEMNGDPTINVDCPNTQNILQMFRKMESQANDDSAGPRPLKEFTPPPEGESYDEDDSDEEYSDEDYTDDLDEEDEEEEDDEEGGVKVQKYKDEFLEMSAKKAAHLRAKFEKWETEVERQNELNKSARDEDGETMPSLDTARNLRAMFENKAKEDALPQKKATPKVNRFVGGGGEKCVACNKTVYAMERLEIVGKLLHKNCFKCVKCNNKLSMGGFSVGGDQLYCSTHYKQAFTEKGSYDIFNSDKDKGKWSNKIKSSSEETIKSQE